jgi:hypothetical protein
MDGVSKEFTALDKAEEELIECLIEVRKLKSHYNDIKIERKNLTDETRNTVIMSLIEEIGDVYVDLFIGLSSVIPEITYKAINERIKYKLKKYKKVIKTLDYNDAYGTIKRGYDIDEIIDYYKAEHVIAKENDDSRIFVVSEKDVQYTDDPCTTSDE